uniref:Uncharacterized protein n=1 Tax=Mycena chlorophos TaxID=658473 RepID=A0ABQ0KXJ3_MYCCL|nr:predicted protein [Mycena chlorophos]
MRGEVARGVNGRIVSESAGILHAVPRRPAARRTPRRVVHLAVSRSWQYWLGRKPPGAAGHSRMWRPGARRARLRRHGHLGVSVALVLRLGLGLVAGVGVNEMNGRRWTRWQWAPWRSRRRVQRLLDGRVHVFAADVLACAAGAGVVVGVVRGFALRRVGAAGDACHMCSRAPPDSLRRRYGHRSDGGRRR